jgi:YD repeat-containing protein
MELCDTFDPIATARTPLRDATSVTITEKYPADEQSGTPAGEESAEMRRDGDARLLVFSGLGDGDEITGIVQTDEMFLVQFADGVLDVLEDGQWASFPANGDVAKELSVDESMDNAIIGDEDLGGMRQFGDSYDLAVYALQSTEVMNGECQYGLVHEWSDWSNGEESTKSSTVSVTVDADGRVTGVDDEDGWAIRVGYEPVSVTLPDASEIAPEAVMEDYQKASERARMHTLGEMIDRQLRAIAAQLPATTDGAMIDPRQAQLFWEMAKVGDIPTDADVTARGANGEPLVVWQGGKLAIDDVAEMDEVLDRIQLYSGWYSDSGYSVCVTFGETTAVAATVTDGECAW